MTLLSGDCIFEPFVLGDWKASSQPDGPGDPGSRTRHRECNAESTLEVVSQMVFEITPSFYLNCVFVKIGCQSNRHHSPNGVSIFQFFVTHVFQ
jgi:hypothetical protein